MILLSHKAHTLPSKNLSPLINICILPDTTRLQNGAAALTDDRQQVLLGLPIAFSYFQNCSKFRTSTSQVVYNIIYTPTMLHPSNSGRASSPLLLYSRQLTLGTIIPGIAKTVTHTTYLCVAVTCSISFLNESLFV